LRGLLREVDAGQVEGDYNAEAFSVETLLERIDRATVVSWMNEPS
jgi:hypothetical protein